MMAYVIGFFFFLVAVHFMANNATVLLQFSATFWITAWPAKFNILKQMTF